MRDREYDLRFLAIAEASAKNLATDLVRAVSEVAIKHQLSLTEVMSILALAYRNHKETQGTT